jgi:hypothetical protein
MSPTIRYRVRQRIVETPILAEAFLRINPGTAISRINPDTKLVLDGFPRSANSYARAAFQLANGNSIGIVTHAHTPRVVQLGVKRGIPVIVLIRDPARVIASILQFTEPDFARAALDSYVRYYRAVLPLLDRVVIGAFPTVTGDFGDVIRKCNARFGTDFVAFERTPENDAAALARVDEEARRVAGADSFDAVVPRPVATRIDADTLLARLDASARRKLTAAHQLHDRVVGAAAAPAG